MALVFLKEDAAETYGVGPYAGRLIRYPDDTFWEVDVYGGHRAPLPFETYEVVRVPAHRAPDREPELRDYYTSTLGKHRKGGN